MSLPMTKIEGVPSKDEVRDGMAYFAATGPFATTCGDCKHRGYYRQRAESFNPNTGQWESKRYKTQACAMHHKLSGRHGSVVKAEWASCKYFERAEPSK